MSHLLLLPETPRLRCVGTPVFTGENTLALDGCVECVYVFARSRFMQPQFPEKNRANESAKFDYDPKVLLCGFARFIKLLLGILSLLTVIRIAYSESKFNPETSRNTINCKYEWISRPILIFVILSKFKLCYFCEINLYFAILIFLPVSDHLILKIDINMIRYNNNKILIMIWV